MPRRGARWPALPLRLHARARAACRSSSASSRSRCSPTLRCSSEPAAGSPSVLIAGAAAVVVALRPVPALLRASSWRCGRCSRTSRATCPTTSRSASAALSLRRRLLLALPLLNIITGVVVAGLRRPRTRASATLGVDVLVAVARRLHGLARADRAARRARSSTRSNDLRARDRARRRRATSPRASRSSATDETGQLAQSFNEMVAGLEERERLREAFGDVRRPRRRRARAARRASCSRARRSRSRVLFLDIRDFTGLAERTERARGRRAAQRLLRARRARAARATAATRTSSSATACWRSSARPSGWPDHADRARGRRAGDRPRRRGASTAAICASASASTRAPSLAGTIGGGGRLRVHRHRRRGQHRLAGRGGHARDRRHGARHRRDARLLTRDHGGFEERPAIELRGKSEPVTLYAPSRTAGADRRPPDEEPLEPTRR